MLAATPPPLVDVKPTREVRTVAPVNEVVVDAGRAGTLVGATQAWEYLLVWSPKGIVVRASLACDTQESNLVLAGNRFAHVCFQSDNFVVTGTLRPLKARIALRAPRTGQVTLTGGGGLIAGSVGPKLYRFDPARTTTLKTYRTAVIALSVDGARILVDRDPRTLEVVSRTGRVLQTLRRPHGGGALMRDGRVATISGHTLVLSGPRRLVRTVAAGARLEDVDGGYAVYSVETRLHLLRLSDGGDVALRLHGQFGYAHAKLWRGGLFYTYNGRTGELGHAGYVARVATLFGG